MRNPRNERSLLSVFAFPIVSVRETVDCGWNAVSFSSKGFPKNVPFEFFFFLFFFASSFRIGFFLRNRPTDHTTFRRSSDSELEIFLRKDSCSFLFRRTSAPAIYLIPRLRAGFSGRTRESAGRLILPYSTLLLMGFARPAGSPRGRWALTPPFHPYRFRGGLLFCGTFPGFAPAGISPASRPAEPGLSSRAVRRRLARIL